MRVSAKKKIKLSLLLSFFLQLLMSFYVFPQIILRFSSLFLYPFMSSSTNPNTEMETCFHYAPKLPSSLG